MAMAHTERVQTIPMNLNYEYNNDLLFRLVIDIHKTNAIQTVRLA